MNTDESRLFYSERYKRTLDFKGSKRVTADTSGGVNEKKAVTLILAATQFGKLYPPIVILGGKSIEKKKYNTFIKTYIKHTLSTKFQYLRKLRHFSSF